MRLFLPLLAAAASLVTFWTVRGPGTALDQARGGLLLALGLAVAGALVGWRNLKPEPSERAVYQRVQRAVGLAGLALAILSLALQLLSVAGLV